MACFIFLFFPASKCSADRIAALPHYLQGDRQALLKALRANPLPLSNSTERRNAGPHIPSGFADPCSSPCSVLWPFPLHSASSTVHLLWWYSKHLKPHVTHGIKEPYLQMLTLSQMKFPDPRWKIQRSLIINIKPVTLEHSQSRPVPRCSPGLLCQHVKLSGWRSWKGAFWRSTCLSPRQALEM